MPELLLEVLSEEIPARMQTRAAAELRRLVTEALREVGLEHGEAESFVTPRRLALVVPDLPKRQPDVTQEKRGPREGAPEQALQGFLKANGLTVTRDIKNKALELAGLDGLQAAKKISTGKVIF